MNKKQQEIEQKQKIEKNEPKKYKSTEKNLIFFFFFFFFALCPRFLGVC
jgi:phosphate starvation-inducible membrane PsiE